MSTTTAATAGTGSDATVVIVPPGEGPRFWIAGDRPTFKLTRAQTGGAYVLSENAVRPQHGPPPHVHFREDELFYIAGGTFRFVLDQTTFTASAGTALFLPRGITHTFKNVGDTTGTLLVLATPAGFDAFVAAGGYDCEADPGFGPAQLEKLLAACRDFGLEMRPDWTAEQSPAPIAPPRDFWVMGLHVRILLGSAQTNGSFSVAEVTAYPGNFVPPHRHHHEDEIFYILEGRFEFDLPQGKVTAPAGTCVRVPRQTLHGFRNASDRPAKLLNYHTPGGFERFFEAAGTPCADVTQGPPTAPPDIEKFIQVCLAHGMEVPPPPPPRQ